MPDGARSLPPAPRTYAELRRAVEAVLVRDQHEVDQAQIMIYWSTGDYIHRFLLQHGVPYGDEVVNKLAADLGKGQRLLYRCLEFRRAYEILSGRTKLIWSHYRVLMLIEDRAKRDALEAAADAGGWKAAELEERVRASSRKSSRRWSGSGSGSLN